MKKILAILSGGFVTGAAFAQCAMCKEALVRSEEGRRLITGMNQGILFLLAAPALIVGLVAVKFLRAYRPGVVEAYVELTKPRLVALQLVVAGLGCYLLGGGVSVPVLVGVALTAGGAAALKSFLECAPNLPAGKIAPVRVLVVSAVLILAGVTVLAGVVNLLTSFLALLAAFLCVLIIRR